MVGHLVRVDRATPLALENVPMGRLGPWLDPVTQLTPFGVSVLVLAAVGISVVARNKISAGIINKTACSRQKILSISSYFLRYFTAATLLLFIYRSIPIVFASFSPTPTPMPSHTPLVVPSSTMDRILDLIQSYGHYLGLSKVLGRPDPPPAPPTRLAPTNLMSTALKLLPWITAEQYLVSLLNISMTTSMLWKFSIAATSSGAVLKPSVRLSFHGLLFAAGVIVLAITRHIDTRLSRVTVELIEQSVGSANTILVLDVVASLPALVLWQNSWLSIPTTFAALLGLGTLGTLPFYGANIRGYNHFISSTLDSAFPTWHQKTSFIYVVVLFGLLQIIQITTTSFIILTTAISGSSKHGSFALSLSRRKREDERPHGTLLGYPFTQALLMNVMPGDAHTPTVQRSWWSRIFDLFTKSRSFTRESACKPISETDVVSMFAIIQELKTAQDQLQGKINGLQAARVSLVEKLRSARRKARVNESAMRRWKARAECSKRPASLEADVHEEVGMAAVQSTISEPTTIDSKDNDNDLGCGATDLVDSGDVEVLKCLLRDIKGDTNRLKVWLDEDSTAPAEPELTPPADIAPILQLRTLSKLCANARTEFIDVVTRVREQDKARRTQLSDELYQQKRSSWSLELASLDLKDNEDALREELYKKEDECEKLKATNKELQEENSWWSNVDALRVDLFRLGRNFLGDRRRGPPTPTSRADPESSKSRPSHPKNRLRTRSSAPLVLSNRHGSVALAAL